MALNWEITGNNSKLMRALKESQQAVQNTANTFEKAGKNIDGVFVEIEQGAQGASNGIKDMIKQMAALGGVTMGLAGLKEFASKMVTVRGEYQKLGVAFNTMLGNKQKADELMQQMIQTAATTPFELSDVANGAKQLLAYNVAAEDVNDTLIRLGDIAAGLSIPLNDLVYLYGTTMAQGRLYTQDLNQFTNRGIPMLSELAKQFNVTEGEVKGLVEAGKVGFPEVQKVIMSLTEEGGKFGGLMSEQSKMIDGQISNLQDALEQMFNKIGKENEDFISDAISGVSSLVENYETVGKLMTAIVATYGAYKAAVMTATALNKLEAVGIAISSSAHGVQAVALGAAAKAQLFLNSAMLANPYVLCATALMGLVAAAWAFNDATDAAERGTKQYNDKLKERIANEEELSRKAKEQVAVVQDQTRGDLERQEALDELKKRYPEIFADYDIETIKLADILDLKKQIAALDGKRNADNVKQDLKDIDAEIAKYEALIKSMGAGNDGYVAKLKELRAQRREAMKEISKITSEEFVEGLKAQDKNTIDKYIKELEKRTKGKDNKEEINLKLPGLDGKLGQEGVFTVEKVRQLIEVAKKKRDGGDEKKDESYVKKANKLYKDWSEAKKIYEKFIKDESKTEKEVKEAKDKMDKIDKQYEELTGSKASAKTKTSSKEDNQKQKELKKIADLQKKQAEEERKMRIKMAIETDQAVIDQMEEGREKRLAQIDLDYNSELLSIEEWYEEIKQKKIEAAKELWDADKKNANKIFDETSVDTSYSEDEKKAYDEKQKAAIASHENAVEEQHKADIRAMNEYLKLYGDMNQKKAAIAAEWEEKIAQARKDKVSDDILAGMQKESLRQQADVEVEALKSMPEYITAFEDLKEASADTLQYLIEKFEAAKGKMAESLDPTDLKTYTDAIKNMQSELIRRDPFSAMKKSAEAAGKAAENVKVKSLEYAKAQEDVKEKSQYVKDAMDEWGEGSDEVIAAQNDLKISTYGLEKAQRDLNQATEDSNNAEEAYKRAIQEASNALGALGSQLQSLGNTMGNTAGDVISVIGQVTSFASTSMNSIKMMMEKTEGAMKAMQDSVAILAIIQAAMEAMQAIANIISSRREEKYQEAKNEYNSLVKVWDDLIAKKKEYLNTSWSGEAAAIGKEIEDLTNKQIESARKVGKEAMEQFWNESVYGMKGGYLKWVEGIYDFYLKDGGQYLKDKFGEEGMKEIFDAISPDRINKGKGIFDLSAEQLQALKEAGDTWGKLPEDVQQYINAIIEGNEKLAELPEMLNDRLVGISFESLKSNFKSAMLDMEKSAEDFTEAFNKMMMEAVLEDEFSKPGGTYDQLEEWRKKWAQFMEGRSKMSSEEQQAQREALLEEYNNIVKAAEEQRDALADFTDYVNTSYIQDFESVKRGFTDLINNMNATAEDFANNFAELMYNTMMSQRMSETYNQQMQDWYDQYKEAAKDGINTEEMNALRSSYEAITNAMQSEAEEIAKLTGYGKDLMMEKMTGTTVDALKSDFDNLVMSFDATAQDFADNFAKYMQDALKKARLDPMLESGLNEWYEQFYAFIESNGELTEAEIETLREKYMSLAQDAQQQAEEIARITGTWEAQMREKAMGTSLDSFKSNFVGMLSSLDGSAEDFADNFSKMMYDALINSQIEAAFGTKMKGLYEKMADFLINGGDVASEEYQTLLDEYIALGNEASNMAEDLANKLGVGLDTLREKFTQTSYSSVRSEFESLLMDMDSNASDFAENFTEYLQKAIINAQMSELLDDNLKKWYKNFATAMEDGNLTDEELNDLRTEYDAIVEDALKQREALANITGYGKGPYSQSGTSAFQGMSQDTGDELNGRFTALQIAGESIESNTSMIAAQMSEIGMQMQAFITASQILQQTVGEITTMLVYMKSNQDEMVSGSMSGNAMMSRKLDAIANKLSRL